MRSKPLLNVHDLFLEPLKSSPYHQSLHGRPYCTAASRSMGDIFLLSPALLKHLLKLAVCIE